MRYNAGAEFSTESTLARLNVIYYAILRTNNRSSPLACPPADDDEVFPDDGIVAADDVCAIFII